MRRLLLGAALALLVCAPAAHARNRWLGDKVLNMAHQGGEAEFPSNTMYAFRKALALGADNARARRERDQGRQARRDA
jgi:glycerophosphoryl diester phosphodiesterase